MSTIIVLSAHLQSVVIVWTISRKKQNQSTRIRSEFYEESYLRFKFDIWKTNLVIFLNHNSAISICDEGNFNIYIEIFSYGSAAQSGRNNLMNHCFLCDFQDIYWPKSSDLYTKSPYLDETTGFYNGAKLIAVSVWGELVEKREILTGVCIGNFAYFIWIQPYFVGSGFHNRRG